MNGYGMSLPGVDEQFPSYLRARSLCYYGSPTVSCRHALSPIWVNDVHEQGAAPVRRVPREGRAIGITEMISILSRISRK